MEAYIKGDIIGKGAYGIVYKVKSVETGDEFAMKFHRLGVVDATVRELSCLAALRGHPYVVQMLDCFVHDGEIAMLMTYVPYTLKDGIHKGYDPRVLTAQGQVVQLTPLSFVAHFSLQVANALSYMHRLNIVHRDLTPSNVLLTDNLTVQVADMGLSRLASDWMSTGVMTEPYRAPELFDVDEGRADRAAEYTCAIDMWSLGVVIADAVEGKPVFGACQDHTGTVSTYQIILRTLCPKGHPHAPTIRRSPEITMPNVMECDIVKRIVFKLLAFRDSERLMASELLQDIEWTQVAARMTEDDKEMVRTRLRQRQRELSDTE